MSYLHPPRLHFVGKFQTAPSTVNNDPDHFNNATFQPSYQKVQDSQNPNGWWNPNGDAVWRLVACQVKSAWTGHDEAAAGNDPILRCLIGDSDRTAPAKIVDLDPEQQMTSEIWGMQVRILLPDGTNLLRARYETTAFMDIWIRASSGGGDTPASAMYQSVLTDLEWGDVASSAFLTTLKQRSQDGLLSIKFNVDGYNMDATSADFTYGRITGMIGPSLAGEPRHFVVGRHFMAAAVPSNGFFIPAGKVNFCTAIVDEQAGKIVLDLGNALPTTTPGGDMVDLGTLAVGYLTLDNNGNPTPNLFAPSSYLAKGWYEQTAGIVTIPDKGKLTADQLTAIAGAPPIVTTSGSDGKVTVAIAEAPNGTYVRADNFVFRLDPGDIADVRLSSSLWGKPYGGARIINILDPLQLQPQAGSSLGPAPPVAVPANIVHFPSRVVADGDGNAEFAVRVSDPKAVRGYIDGQVYGVRSMLEDDLAVGSGYNFNPAELVSLLVWQGFAADHPPTWHGSIEPIFTLYANLYPVMKPIVDLKNYESVCANVKILSLAFGLPIEDPNAMPVTRDLSDAKRKAILHWLSHPGPDGKPLKGTPQPAAARAAAARSPAHPQGGAPIRGGKAMAASRRLALRYQ